MNEEYWKNLAIETDRIFKAHPGLKDHRAQYPWLVGALGNPFAGIWFVAENPSLTQVERVQDPTGGKPTIEAQWWSSRGDKLFREMLCKYGFKNGGIDSPGGWNCYITNVIKETDYTKEWREKPQSARNNSAEIWSSLFSWELKNSKPRLVVIMGNQTVTLLQHLVNRRKFVFPKTEQITHYGYIGQRAQGHLGPMHPTRIAEYDKEFAKIKKIFDAIP